MTTTDTNAIATAGHFPRLLFWIAAFALGFMYVAAVLCDRATPITGPRDMPYEFWKLCVAAAVLYAIGAHRTLKPFNAPHGGGWNVAGFGIPFFVALHWDNVGHAFPWLNHSLTPQDFARMTWAARGVFIGGAVLIAGLAVFHGWLAWRERILRPYAAGFVAMLALLLLVTAVLYRSHYFHIHHYFVGLMFIPWMRFPHPITLVCLGLCSGVFVEGTARWGMAALWYPW